MARSVAYYSLYDGDEFIGIYRAKELVEMLGIQMKHVSQYEESGSRYKRRWRFERVEASVWAEEWDRVRLEILRRGKVKE